MTDPWEEKYIHPHEWLIFMINDGNYTSPMHGMGYLWGIPMVDGVLMYCCVVVHLGHLMASHPLMVLGTTFF